MGPSLGYFLFNKMVVFQFEMHNPIIVVLMGNCEFQYDFSSWSV